MITSSSVLAVFDSCTPLALQPVLNVLAHALAPFCREVQDAATLGSSDGLAPPGSRHKKSHHAVAFVADKEQYTPVLMLKSFTWHRAIFAGGYPPTIVAAAAFHARVRDGSGWDHNAMDTRIDLSPGEP